jgi:hypothetical protein
MCVWNGPSLVKWLEDFADRNEAQVGARDRYAVALDMWYGRKSPEAEALDKAAAEHVAAQVKALAPEEYAALNNCLAGNGSPLEAAKVLRHRPELLETWHPPDTEFVRTVRGLVQLSTPAPPFPLFTSIRPPTDAGELSYLRHCLNSWRSAGFQAVAVNGPAEARNSRSNDADSSHR